MQSIQLVNSLQTISNCLQCYAINESHFPRWRKEKTLFANKLLAAAPVYGVYLSQLIRWIHCSSTCIWSISFSVDTVFQISQFFYGINIVVENF
jgi:hypothetical protein